jgi:hypothetical protein
MTIKQAKQVLQDHGYYVDNLWHIDDVKSKSDNIDDDDLYSILDQALTSAWIMEQINTAISDLVE